MNSLLVNHFDIVYLILLLDDWDIPGDHKVLDLCLGLIKWKPLEIQVKTYVIMKL